MFSILVKLQNHIPNITCHKPSQLTRHAFILHMSHGHRRLAQSNPLGTSGTFLVARFDNGTMWLPSDPLALDLLARVFQTSIVLHECWWGERDYPLSAIRPRLPDLARLLFSYARSRGSTTASESYAKKVGKPSKTTSLVLAASYLSLVCTLVEYLVKSPGCGFGTPP